MGTISVEPVLSVLAQSFHKDIPQ